MESKELACSGIGFHRAKAKITLNDLLSSRNYGIEARTLEEVHEEVNQATEKASDLKSRRQEQAAGRREKLKASSNLGQT